MNEQSWALFDAGGVLVGQLALPAGAAPSARDGSFAKAVKTARQADPTFERVDPVNGAVSDDVARVEAMLLAQVKAESERRRMTIYTANRGKMKEYQAKKQEVLDYRALGNATLPPALTLAALLSLFNALTAADRNLKFPFAQADAAIFGDTVDKAIARFEAGMAISDAPIARLAAVEQKACLAIRAAATAAAKRAVFASINWNWAP